MTKTMLGTPDDDDPHTRLADDIARLEQHVKDIRNELRRNAPKPPIVDNTPTIKVTKHSLLKVGDPVIVSGCGGKPFVVEEIHRVWTEEGRSITVKLVESE